MVGTSKQLPYETFPCSIRRVWDTTTIESSLRKMTGQAESLKVLHVEGSA